MLYLMYFHVPPAPNKPMVASASPIPPIDLARMAEEQLRDPKVAELRKQPGALKLKEVNLDGCILLCDVSTSRPRPIVPPLWTKTIFEAIHNLSHPGHKPTTRAISAPMSGLDLNVKLKIWYAHVIPVKQAKLADTPKLPSTHWTLQIVDLGIFM